MDRAEMEKHFNYETDIFRLRVALTGNKLSLQLEDLVNRVVYAKQIHKQKIDKDGLNKPKDQLIKFQQVLKLNKLQVMNQNQVQTQSIRQQKMVFMQKIQVLNNKNLGLQNQNSHFKNQNIDLQQKNSKLQDKLAFIQKQLQNIKKQKGRFNKQSDSSQEEFWENKRKLKIQKELDQLRKFKQQISLLIPFMPKPIKLAMLMQSYPNKFEITPTPTSCTIKYKGQWKFTQFIFNQVMPYNQQITFQFKIIKSNNSAIMIGVVDQPKQRNQRYSWNSKNAVCYSGWRYKFPSNIQQGDGFKEGETVETTVYLANKTVKWTVNGVLRATQVYQALADKTRTFRPYIEMTHSDDIVEYIV